jgi:tRNA1Val (adenine37-N6)-methyltransferase
MHDPVFRFRRFAVRQDRCAMKVGTDAVLLGAWVETFPARRILDVGTGTGLIALMLAQRFRCAVDAIEIDREACGQAGENFSASPWPARLRIIHTSLQAFSKNGAAPYDLVVSNPPFYVDAFTAPSRARSVARHSNIQLSFDDLLDGVVRLLQPEGRFCLILPDREAQGFLRSAAGRLLFPRRLARVKTKPGGPVKRSLLELGFGEAAVKEEELTLLDESSGFTPEYIRLTSEYYLWRKKDAAGGE